MVYSQDNLELYREDILELAPEFNLESRITTCTIKISDSNGKIYLGKIHPSFIPGSRRHILVPAEIIQRFNPNDTLPAFRGLFENQRACMYILDWIEGLTLDLYYKDKVPSSQEIAKIGFDISRTLVEMLKYNAIHRDIKPTNIVGTGSQFRLIDFDTLNIIGGQVTGYGTIGYCDLEDSPTSPTNDIHCLGITLLELMGMKPIYSHGSLRIPEAPCSQEEKKLIEICQRMIAKYPSNRPTAEILIDSFSNLM